MKRSDGPGRLRRHAAPRAVVARHIVARARANERTRELSERGTRRAPVFFFTLSRRVSTTTDDGRRTTRRMDVPRVVPARARAGRVDDIRMWDDARGRLGTRERLGAGDARWESLVAVLLAVLSRRRRRRSVRTARATTTLAGALRRRREIASASPARPTDRGTVSR